MKKLLMFAFLMALPAGAMASGASSDDLAWDHPTARVDGTALAVSEIAATEIEVRKGTTVVASASVTPDKLTWVYIRPSAMLYGTLCYVARTVDTDGLVSDWSAEVCKTVKARPNGPRNFRVK